MPEFLKKFELLVRITFQSFLYISTILYIITDFEMLI